METETTQAEAPRPATFADLGLSEPTLRAVAELGYEEPTPIQALTIGRMLAGADVIAQAQTGTGKTAAFALPIVDRVESERHEPQALVLTPTRELAMQVAEAFHSYGRYRGVTTLPVYGGQPIERQLRALQRGVHVVVGTPGRILDHIGRGTLRLDGVRVVVLDEADEMLAMGFIEDIEAILSETPAERQTALFSATIPQPIADLARRYMREPERVVVAARQLTVPQIRQVYYEVGGRDKFEVLARVLDFETPTSAIIFCRTKSEVDALGERLTARAYPAETLHGDLSQVQRDRVMARFRTGQAELLVATDVAARGLDVEHVSHVINYDIPLDPEVYVHRIGRTGRAGRTGSAITLVKPRERGLLRTIERITGAPIQRLRLPTIADVIARRREAFKETLRETVEQGGLEPYTILAEELAEEFSPTDLAAAAFRLLLGEPLEGAEDALAAAEPDLEARERTGRRRFEREDGERRPYGERRDFGGRREFGPERGMTRLFLDVGRDDGVRPADIVGAIANEAGIPGRAVGAIELFERFAFVEVPEAQANKVLRALKNTTIRGRRIAPSLARPRR
ncbi:MAG TPA: DEAD/DEAH box helicase [Roseiflexaceae bacterium]|nr:DEAD/DEAH box helicase [Roseiflexaceae bacterium]